MMFEYPKRPEGSVQGQILDLWDYLFKLVEQLNITQVQGGAGNDNSAGH